MKVMFSRKSAIFTAEDFRLLFFWLLHRVLDAVAFLTSNPSEIAAVPLRVFA